MARACRTIAFGVAALSSCRTCLGLSIDTQPGLDIDTQPGLDTDELTGTCGAPGVTFSQFIQKFNRGYKPGSQEYSEREALFVQRSKMIEEHNCFPKGPWKAAVNHFADWTDAELQQLRGHRPNWGGRSSSATAGYTELSEGDADNKWPRKFHFGRRGESALSRFPQAFSWSNLTSIKEEKNQGQCGSCWAFASDTTLRAHAEISGRDHKFSVSQVVACAPNTHHCGGTGGCKGSTAELAFEYIMIAGAVTEDEMEYPEGGGQDVCPQRLRTPANDTNTPFRLMEDGSEVHTWPSKDARHSEGNNIGMTGWTKLPENREEAVVRTLVEVGPVAIAVAAGFEWNFYYQGIMNHKGCDKDHVINHAVVLFGYGSVDQTSPKQRYWLIKNSWGSNWGERGNLRLERTSDDEKACGWDKKPQLGSGCDGGPKEVYVCGTCGVLYDAVIPHFAPVISEADKQKAFFEQLHKRFRRKR